MDKADILRLNGVTASFYAHQAQSFSDTRQAPWPGWERLVEAPVFADGAGGSLRVLDIGCGNLRFERFLTQRLPRTLLRFYCVDNCPDFLQPAHVLHLIEGNPAQLMAADVIERLVCDGDLGLEVPPCDVVVAFGLMHHVPTAALRQRMVQELFDHVVPGGVLALSLWRFASNPDMRRKAQEAHQRALEAGVCTGIALEPGDYLLGWQQQTRDFRFCHSFEDEEIDALVAGLSGVSACRRYMADGRTGDLNAYVVITKA